MFLGEREDLTSRKRNTRVLTTEEEEEAEGWNLQEALIKEFGEFDEFTGSPS